MYWEASHTKMQLQQEGENTIRKDQKQLIMYINIEG